MRAVTREILFRKILLLSIMAIGISLSAQQLVINEILADNESGLTDFEGELTDWIEIYNPASTSIDLSAYQLSDELNSWQFPQIILDGNSYLLIYATGKDTIVSAELHCNFSVNSTGETIRLLNSENEVIDEAPYEGLLPDQSLMRDPLNSHEWIVTSQTSPLEENTPLNVGSMGGGLSLNEISSNPVGGDDWIEIYNGSPSTASLNGYFLSDDATNLQKWQFPTAFVAAYSVLKINASGLDAEIEGELHTNFAINKNGEEVFLSGPFGGIIERIRIPALNEAYSFGRKHDGEVGWIEFCQASVNDLNTNSLEDVEMIFSLPPGHYLEEQTLDIICEEEVRYTTDGSPPDINSNIWMASMTLGARTGEPDVYSIVQCTEEPFAPVVESKKVNIIRARAFRNGEPYGKVFTKTYLIDENPERYTVPVISLVGDPDYFFDEEIGICKNYSKFGSEWEREISMEFFESGQLAFDQKCGIRMHGKGSRLHKQKSFRLYARSEYGQKHFEYPFFESTDIQQFKRLVLRSARGVNNTFYCDELAASICEDFGFGTQANAQVVVFLNGEYWGLYHLRERGDEHYFADTFQTDEDSVSIIDGNPFLAGACTGNDCSPYLDMLAAMEQNEISDSLYAEIEKLLDIDNLIDYLCANLYCNNTDWPYHNYRFWGDSQSGKWNPVFFDLDHSLVAPEANGVAHFFEFLLPENSWYRPAGRLFEYPLFKIKFLQRFEELLNTSFYEDVVKAKIDQLENSVFPEYEELHLRYANDVSPAYRLERVERLREFAELRACFLREQIYQHFDTLLTVTVCDSTALTDTTVQALIDFSPNEKPNWTVKQNGINLEIAGELPREIKCRIFQLSGKLACKETAYTDGKKAQLSLPELSSGIYVLHLFSGESAIAQRLFIDSSRFY